MLQIADMKPQNSPPGVKIHSSARWLRCNRLLRDFLFSQLKLGDNMIGK